MAKETNKSIAKQDGADKEAEEVVDYLHRTFQDVFREKLRKEDRMDFNPAELVLINEDVEPWHRGWAREVPAHYMEEGRALINDLLEAGVISEVTKPVALCTQGFFVPKGDSNKLRLVTDYRQLNKALDRPDWPFLPSEAVRSRRDPGARVFGAMDLTSGYHQVPLTKADRDLTTFTLPFGRYRYEVLPMD